MISYSWLVIVVVGWTTDHSIAYSRPKRITEPMDRLINTCLDDLHPISSKDTQSYLYKSHMNAVFNLIRSDVQNKTEFRGVSPYPSDYLDTLREIYSTTSRLESLSHPILPLVKIIIKKEGLPKDIGHLREVQVPSRDIVEIKRKVERAFSMILLSLVSYRLSLASTIDRDFIFFAKPLLELVPVQDRHFAFLLFCKGLFAPNFALNHSNKDVQAFLRSPYPSLLNSYRLSMESIPISQISVYARLLFPFAVTSLRCHSYLKRSKVFVEEKNYLPEDLRVMRFFATCKRFESENTSNRSLLPCKGDEILYVMLR